MKTGIESLLNPNSVAVFGVSEQEGKAGNQVVKHLLEGNVKFYGINPKGGTLWGHTIYRSIEELPEAPDLAVIALPAKPAVEAARVSADRGVGSVIVIAGGFSEVGAEGWELEMKLKSAVAGKGTRILGPNTLGLLIPRLKLDTIFLPSTHLRRPEPGQIAIISQSGSGVMGAVDVGAFRGATLGAFVGLGNRTDIDENELIAYFGDDPDTLAIGLYLESFKDAQKFVDVCCRVTPRKPIVLVKAGRSPAGAKAVALHTGSLAGSDRVTGGVLNQLGIFRAYDDEELFDTLRTLAYMKPITGRRVAILTGGGGMGVMTADYAEAVEEGFGFTLATLSPDTEAKLARIAFPFASVHNPIDLTPTAENSMYDYALEILQDDPGVDVIIVSLMYHSGKKDRSFTERLCYWAKEGRKPLVVAAIGSETTVEAVRQMEAAGVLSLPSFRRAVRAADILVKRAEFLSRRSSGEEGVIAAENPAIKPTSLPKPGKSLAEDEVKEILRQRGVSTPDSIVLRKGELPEKMFLPYPLVLKIRSADVLHKTELKGVMLDIKNKEALEKAAGEMRIRFPGQDLLLEQMENHGVEIIVGLIDDSTFGLSIMCGIGGVLAELYQDVAFRRLPIDRLDAESMLTSLKAYALLDGFRGIKANREAVIDLLLKVSSLGQDLSGEIEQMDLNPIIVREDKAVVVDAKLIWKKDKV